MSSKISALSALSSLAIGDLLNVVDISDTTMGASGTNKKVLVSDLLRRLALPGTDITAASTTDLSTATGAAVTITGNTTITSFGTVDAGVIHILTFSGTPVITYNATSLKIPTSASVTAAAGDVAWIVSLGSGNWKIITYQRADGTALAGGAPPDADYLVKTANTGLSAERVVTDTTPITWDWGTAGQAKATIAGATTLYGALDALTVTGANVASATTTDIGAATGESITITGTTTITGLGTKAAGCLRFVTFSGALILTYNATSLILPTAANITTVAGDTAIFVSLGSGNWKCLIYSRASGAALAGSSTVPYVKLEEQQSSGTDGGQFTSGAQRTRTLNTKTDPSSLCTLSSNQFVLASGTWEIEAYVPASYVDNHQAFLRNVTTGTNELISSTQLTNYGAHSVNDNRAIIVGRFASNGSDAYEIQHRCYSTNATYGFGYGGFNTWGNVVFTQVMLRKVG